MPAGQDSKASSDDRPGITQRGRRAYSKSKRVEDLETPSRACTQLSKAKTRRERHTSSKRAEKTGPRVWRREVESIKYSDPGQSPTGQDWSDEARRASQSRPVRTSRPLSQVPASRWDGVHAAHSRGVDRSRRSWRASMGQWPTAD